MPEPAAALELAVIGAGPRALFSLEALAVRLADAPPTGLRVTVIESGEHPGTGSGYALDQPDCLRLNVDARILDAPATGDGPSFAEWVRRADPEAAGEPYPPRALVGRYLHERWQRLEAALRALVPLTLHRGRAVGVDRGREGETRVRVLPDGDGREQVLGPFAEVLVVTGHASGHTGALAPAWRSTIPLREGVLPVAAMLSAQAVPPGARVALRGAALTFLDAALALTEGRGGRFRPAPDGSGLVHERASAEPAVLLPTSREGLLLDAKPDPRTPLPEEVRAVLERGADDLAAALRGAEDGPATVHAAVLDTATAVLAAADAGTAPTAGREAVAHVLAHGCEPDLPRGPGRAAGMLRRGVAVAEGRRAPGPAWALGRTWSALLPTVMRGLRGTDAPEEAMLRFRGDAARLERLAFGPPLDTARRLLAMLDSGALDLSWLDAGVRITGDGLHGIPEGSAPADVVLDAVLPPPGAIAVNDPLLGSLLADAGLHVRPGRRGVRTAGDGTPVDAYGHRLEGLAVIGRAAEDEAFGHDTLNRHLHPEPEAWAERLARRLSTLPSPIGETAG
ncbi:FAD/NAD(P)-binding protein [Brachybacterium squillarum]|uniref:FAD/NAD(P)-binding protein n=1 Tax=Brachybacterium squillarum TaxID=661979 RepID=UPI0002629C5D|nr:FAD/NAD(P)-binding domain-containing protein [Brachybacterium squillarum]